MPSRPLPLLAACAALALAGCGLTVDTTAPPAPSTGSTAVALVGPQPTAPGGTTSTMVTVPITINLAEPNQTTVPDPAVPLLDADGTYCQALLRLISSGQALEVHRPSASRIKERAPEVVEALEAFARVSAEPRAHAAATQARSVLDQLLEFRDNETLGVLETFTPLGAEVSDMIGDLSKRQACPGT